MAQAAYRYNSFLAQEPAPSYRPDVRVVPGGREDSQSEAKPVTGSLVFKLIIAVMVVFALTCFATITLKSATSAVLSDTKTVESSMNSIKSDSTTLEVQNSALSNTSTIKAHAEKIGMSAPYEVDTIVLSKDVVATDASGSLSLSGSIKNAAEIQG